MAAGEVIPPPPAGFTMQDVPPPPSGFKLEAAAPYVPSGERSALADVAMKQAMPLVKGFATGGPVGAAVAGGQQGLKTAGDVIGDASYAAGGAATDLAAKRLSPEASAAIGSGVNLIGQTVPAMLAGGNLGARAAPAMESGARTLMNAALKPSAAQHASGDAGRAVNTMLEGGYNVTAGGVRAMQAEIGKLNDAITQAIAKSPATVDKQKVAATLQDALKRFEMQVTPGADMRVIEKAYQEFLAHPLLAGNTQIPIQLAQKLKQGTYGSLGNKAFGELKGADVEAQKTLARGLKEGIAEGAPEVAPLNAAEGKLINAKDIAEHRVNMNSNKQQMGLGWLSGSPEGALGWLLDRSPLANSVLARALHSGSTAIPRTVGQAVGATAGRVATLPPQQNQ